MKPDNEDVGGGCGSHPPIPFHKPYTDALEEEAVAQVLRSGWLTMGPQTAAFEDELAAYVDAC